MSQIRTGQITPSSEAWPAWIPTWTNLTIGNATVIARYTQVGKNIYFFVILTFGSTSSITGGYPTFSLPAATKLADANANANAVCTARYLQTGTAWFHGIPALSGGSSNSVSLGCLSVSGSFITEVGINATIPFTWATGHKMYIQGFYEAA